MYKFIEKTKGAISIFLIIILLPMMTISALFVDAGRVELAKSVATSAGDLALNTALSNYDTDLKDLYGLFATAQDKDDLFSKLEDYYRASIMSAGVDENIASIYADKITNSLKNSNNPSETADLLNMQLTDFNVSALDNGNLANATVLKKQIVEFMKYRCPINTGLSFITSLKSFSTLSDQTKLADDRNKYYTAKSDAMSNLEKAWEALNEYDQTKFMKEKDYCESITKSVENFEEDYHKITTDTIMNLYKADEKYWKNKPVEYSYKEEDILEGSEKIKGYKLYYDNKEYDTGSLPYDDGNKASERNVKSSIRKLNNNIVNEEDKRNNLLTYDNGTTYGVQYILQTNRNNLYADWSDAVIDMYKSYRNLVNAYAHCNKKDKIKGEYETAINSFNEYVKSNNIQNVNSDMKNAFNEVGDKCNNSETNNRIKKIYTEINEFITEESKAITALEKAEKHINKAINNIDKAEQKRKEWKGDANKESIRTLPMAQQDMMDINIEADQFKKAEFKELLERVKSISKTLEQMCKQIKGYEVYKKSLSDIENYSVFEKLLGKKLGDEDLKNVPLNINELENYTNSKWKEAFKVKEKFEAPAEEKLSLKKDTPQLYKYMKSIFKNNTYDKEEAKKAKEKNKEIKKLAKETAEERANEPTEKNTSDNKITDLISKSELPSNGNSKGCTSGEIKTGDDATEKTSKTLGGLFRNIGDNITDMLDSIYVSDYIMSMFSYDTIKEETPKGEPKTLTCEPINPANNYLYGGEAEYIIYGNKNAKTNIAEAYGTIYAVRLGFNVVYAFSSSDVRDTAFAMATPISAASGGIIPVPLIQSAIIIGCACCESGADLEALRNGESVPLFKNQQTWRTSFKGFGNQAKDAIFSISKYAIDEGVRYLTAMLDMTDEELGNYIEKHSEAVVDSVTNSFDTLIQHHAFSAIQATTTAINNAIMEKKFDPSINIEDYVITELDDWLEGQAKENTSLENHVKQIAVNAIKNEFLGKLIESIENGTDGHETKNILTKIKNTIKAALESDNSVAELRIELKQKVNAAINTGAEELKNLLHETLDKTFGQSKGINIDGTGTASVIAFSYKDYLRLFTLIGLTSNQESVLLRTADVIQLNMMHKKNDNSYRLCEAVTYVKMDADIQVKPVLIALPLFSGLAKNTIDNTAWYSIKYSDKRGY